MQGRRFAGGVLIWTAALAQAAPGDRVTLLDGATLHGSVTHLDADGIEVAQCGSRTTYLRSKVRSIEFNPMEAAPKGGASMAACAIAAMATRSATLAAGTRLVVKTSRPIDSTREPIGQVFGGSIAESVSQGELLLIRKGAPALLQLQSVQHQGLPF
jgi:hypothetical protein